MSKGADSIIRPFVSVSIQWEPVAWFPPFRGWLERVLHAPANSLGFMQLVLPPFLFRHCRAGYPLIDRGYASLHLVEEPRPHVPYLFDSLVHGYHLALFPPSLEMFDISI